MDRYGSDKPDTRFGMELQDVTEVVKDCEFVVFKGAIEQGGTCLLYTSGLCGAAVAYKLIECLHESVGRDAEDLDDLIENVAIATVGDVMDLVDEDVYKRQGLGAAYFALLMLITLGVYHTPVSYTHLLL